jgi:hypothetical protein
MNLGVHILQVSDTALIFLNIHQLGTSVDRYSQGQGVVRELHQSLRHHDKLKDGGMPVIRSSFGFDDKRSGVIEKKNHAERNKI